MSIAIKAENIGKAYQLGEFSTGTISRDIERWWALLRGKEDPFLKLGETNDRSTKGTSDIVWSLKDINFEINQGDAVGIIGKNGAGKSTLLKVLSRVTTPTTGNIKVKGRIASLLEVGTGFHPELTGRENIFLNGAILGMRKHEIKKHFDAIVDFSGVERYIDTPVKRYSSGMYVRLAFAVAAHLESEILIVDEVLAVGDAEFQKKCLGKMGEVSKGEGRTVLFVSHNMAAVRNLCDKGLLLSQGVIEFSGTSEGAINKYLSLKVNQFLVNNFTKYKILQTPWFSPIEFKATDNNFNILNNYIPINEPINIHIKFNSDVVNSNLSMGFTIYDSHENVICFVTERDMNPILYIQGVNEVVYTIPPFLLNEGDYFVELNASIHKHSWIIEPNDNSPIINFTIKGYIGESDLWNVSRQGIIAPLIYCKKLD